MNEKKMRKRNFTFAALLLIMVFALCITLISCGGSETGETAKNEVKVEQTAEGNADSKETKNEQDEEVAVKKEDKKETAQKTETQKTTQKATQKATTEAATQAKKVCYITIEGYCGGKEISLQGGDTAYSILCRSGASVSGSGHYVKGINGRFEFDEGPTSGWVYYVNGSRPTVGCGSYSIKAGDSITWDYVTKL